MRIIEYSSVKPEEVLYRGANVKDRALEDRVTGLDSGADYYLAKPFESAELISCLHAITRRGGSEPVMELHWADLRLEQKNGKLRCDRTGQDIKLGIKEYQLICY